LLDEPTNHLDLDMRQALAEALQGYEGALVLVSHDRHLLRVTSDALLLVDAGTVTPFDGSIDDYPAWLAARQGAESDSMAGTGAGSAGGSGRESQARKDQRRQDAEQRRRSQPLRSRLQALEARLTALTARRTELEQDLSATELYEAAAKPRLLGMLEEKRLVDEELGQVEGDWLDTSEALEAMQGDGP